MNKTLYIPIDTTIYDTFECPKLVKRGDILTLRIKVFTDGALRDLTGQNIDIILQKADGTLIENTINIANIANGVVTANLDIQATVAAGIVSGELQLSDESGQESTNTFTFEVKSSLADDVIEVSKDDINTLNQLRDLIETGEMTIAEYETHILAIANSIEAIEALGNIKAYIDTNLDALENENAEAVANINNLQTKNSEAITNQAALEQAIEEANTFVANHGDIIDLDNRVNQNTAQLSDVVQQNYYKTIPKKYNGFNMYLPFSSEYGTYQSVIDNAVRLGAKCINVCIRMTMATVSSETLTLATTQTDLVNAVAYAKSKGLKVFIKPHVNQNSWNIYQNVVSTTNWLNSYSSLLIQAVTWVKDSIDIVGISNELYSQTNVNLSLWQGLIANIRALNSNIKISCSITKEEITTNLYLPYIDYIGCNLYIGVSGDLTANLATLKKNIFRDYNSDVNYIDMLHNKATSLNKKILITEVGILPIIDSLKSPATWSYDSAYYEANKNLAVQTLYYNVFMSTFMNDTIIDGVIIWSLTDGFTPIGNTECETIISNYFGGGY